MNQIIQPDVQRIGQFPCQVQIRNAFPAFPLGDGLPCDAYKLRQGFLGQMLLFPKNLYTLTNHPFPTFQSGLYSPEQGGSINGNFLIWTEMLKGVYMRGGQPITL